ncbi:hypothetical protein PCANC_28507 [Puccinia coronata f. sp. avenae]|uniref:Uncharacterized protein n=1 Tax=Puccinia coronata f. sp. avenae TaxID=200324 RepID=A0A2N5TFI3_9BASI|nr:hypothetical protein PCANC_28507 [Puccinia coronata f. sp. avenae]
MTMPPVANRIPVLRLPVPSKPRAAPDMVCTAKVGTGIPVPTLAKALCPAPLGNAGMQFVHVEENTEASGLLSPPPSHPAVPTSNYQQPIISNSRGGYAADDDQGTPII